MSIGYQLAIFVRFFFAALFATAVLSKVTHPRRLQQFVQATGKMMMVSWRKAIYIAMAALCCEAGAVVLLLAPGTSRSGFVLVSGLLLVFSAVISGALRRDVFSQCGCFGSTSSRLGHRLLARNILLLAVALSCAVSPLPELRPIAISSWTAAVTGALTALALIRYYDALATLLTRRSRPPREMSASIDK
ncbi:MauE/DoxX family redox-associated membrane protein [Actinomadura terrae]|uniref:MauE/DoxX family redox-associated membrane protein n=1 Tax=Actinomadura terrae TaxID=604353 RepID=UPI001FA7F3E3|nr:MauE/DoxX family redox-associated membrane protein [Actinomadura terrae]